MARKSSTAAQSAAQPQEQAPNPEAQTEQQPAIATAAQSAAADPARVDPPADVEQQPDAPIGDGKEQPGLPAGVVLKSEPYVHPSGFRRVVNHDKNTTQVEIDIFSEPGVRLGTTKLDAQVWSNLVAAVGR